MFGSTYICEAIFSDLGIIKSKNRSLLTDEHLKSLLIISRTNLDIDFEEVIADSNDDS